MKRSSFSVDLRASINEALFNVEQTVKDSVNLLVSKIVSKTPVDTGQLKKNWNTSLGSVDLTLHDINAEDSLSRSIKVMNGYTVDTKQVWVSNNLPYAYDIEYGKSQIKAPQGMLRVSLQEFDTIVTGSAMKVNKGAGSKQNRYL